MDEMKIQLNSMEKCKKLDTIQKYDKLNNVYAVDEAGPGGAHHKYALVFSGDEDGALINSKGVIQFQCGPRKDPNSEHGWLDTDLLEIVRDRLKDFQNGPFATDDNAKALEHIEIALMYMNKRVEERAARGVLGTNTK